MAEKKKKKGEGESMEGNGIGKAMKKLQVFYYLSRNGQLEQPHFVELNLPADHPLRLRDVMDRLAVLRGKAMPSLYSWSCKRNYKSGYVWNDLSENDIVYPADAVGAEYVLKGSQLLQLSSEKLQQIQVSNSNRQPAQESHLPSKPRKQQLAPSPLKELDDSQPQDYELEYDEVEELEYEDGEKGSYTTSTTPHSRCSRGVSTDELEDPDSTRPLTQKLTESTRFDSSRLSSASPIATDQQQTRREEHTVSKRFTDDDELGAESAPSRSSVLLQFIACGSSAVSKGKTGSGSREPAKEIGSRTESLRKGVMCKIAGKLQVGGDEEMINYMSENPRFGNLQSEEKEYFSGSIVESIREDRHVAKPALKKSNSYNEEKSKRGEFGEKRDGEEKRPEEEDGCGKGRCLPRMISAAASSSKQPTKP